LSIDDLIKEVDLELPDSSEYTKQQLDDVLYLMKRISSYFPGLFDSENQEGIRGGDVVEEICYQANEMAMHLWIGKLNEKS